MQEQAGLSLPQSSNEFTTEMPDASDNVLVSFIRSSYIFLVIVFIICFKRTLKF